MNLTVKPKAPGFIGIGMERAGTSWLFTQLASHPDIWVPPLKEIHYFDVIDPQAKFLDHRYSYHLKSRIKQKAAPFVNTVKRPEFGKNSYFEYLLWDASYFTGKADIQWYQRLFSDRFTKGRVSGEITPAYSNLTSKTIQMILSMNPDIKFLLMVRNPVQRLWSGVVHYFTHVKKRNFSDISEKEILDYLKESQAANRSDLHSILTTWQAEVSSDQLLIQSFEDILSDPEKIIQECYEFLGVGHDYLPPEYLYKRKINAYTKKRYDVPPAIQSYMEEQCQSGIELLKNSHPEIVEKWQ